MVKNNYKKEINSLPSSELYWVNTTASVEFQLAIEYIILLEDKNNEELSPCPWEEDNPWANFVQT